MIDSWITTKIGDQITLQRGFDITKQLQRPGTVPVVSTAGILSHHDTAMARGPGVIIGRKGNSIGRAHFVEQDYWPHDTTLWIRDFKGNDPKFAYYFFVQMFERLQSLDVGSANPTLNRNHVHPIVVRWPPLAEQKRIAHILGTLDDKIELNRRMNATLEAMARAFFQSWFVDFDPVRRNAEGGESRPEDALFPDSFEDSELGEIPKGWWVGKVSDFTTFGRESVNPGASPEELFHHYSLPAFDDGRTPKIETGGDIKSNKLVVPSNAVLLSKLNPHIPRIWFPEIDSECRSVCSTEFLVACPKPSATREYLFSLFTSNRFSSEYATLVTGTTGSHQRIKAEAVLNLNTVIPPKKHVAEFTGLTQPLFSRINKNIAESRTLAALRDTLLPKLLSGELGTGSAQLTEIFQK